MDAASEASSSLGCVPWGGWRGSRRDDRVWTAAGVEPKRPMTTVLERLWKQLTVNNWGGAEVNVKAPLAYYLATPTRAPRPAALALSWDRHRGTTAQSS